MNENIENNQELVPEQTVPTIGQPEVDPVTGQPVIFVQDEEAIRTTEAEVQPVI